MYLKNLSCLRIRVFAKDKDNPLAYTSQPTMARDSASDRLRFFLAEERMDAPSPQPSGASQPPLTMTPTRPRNGRR
ncbi:unnamed protein product [Musa hybrid cultivar]